MDKKIKIILLSLFLLLVSCTDLKVKRENSDINSMYRNTIVFLNHSGDTIVKCQSNEVPDIYVERLVGGDSKTYYIKLDSLEYLELYFYNDAFTTKVRWQIRKK